MEIAALGRLRRLPGGFSVEALQERAGRLTAERQELRTSGASRAELEANRRLLVETQWELSHALIERYLPGLARRAA